VTIHTLTHFDATDLPALTKSCHAQDQATTTLHEVTHLSQIKGTQDLGYGYSAAIRLSATQALNNADSYALFANGEFVVKPFGCPFTDNDNQSRLCWLLNVILWCYGSYVMCCRHTNWLCEETLGKLRRYLVSWVCSTQASYINRTFMILSLYYSCLQRGGDWVIPGEHNF
jgi:hypothetical protein